MNHHGGIGSNQYEQKPQHHDTDPHRASLAAEAAAAASLEAPLSPDQAAAYNGLGVDPAVAAEIKSQTAPSNLGERSEPTTPPQLRHWWQRRRRPDRTTPAAGTSTVPAAPARSDDATPEEVAWAFDADRQSWVDAGFDYDTAKPWIDQGFAATDAQWNASQGRTADQTAERRELDRRMASNPNAPEDVLRRLADG